MVFVRLENCDDLITLRLWEAGTLGITEGDGFVDAFFEDAETASQFGVPETVVDVDWVARTYEAFPPLLVGEKFFIGADGPLSAADIVGVFNRLPIFTRSLLDQNCVSYHLCHVAQKCVMLL